MVHSARLAGKSADSERPHCTVKTLTGRPSGFKGSLASSGIVDSFSLVATEALLHPLAQVSPAALEDSSVLVECPLDKSLPALRKGIMATTQESAIRTIFESSNSVRSIRAIQESVRPAPHMPPSSGATPVE